MDTDIARAKLEACLSHADDLLRSAKNVLETDKLPNVSYHLAALALEEIGKAGFFAVFEIPEKREQTQEYFKKRFEDHYQKLFWAIWTPLLTGRRPFTKEAIESAQELALDIHKTRQQGLYVNFDASDQTAPRDAIPDDKAKNLIEFVEARRELVTFNNRHDLSEPELERLRFFFSVLEHQHFRPFVFSTISLEKLAEFGSVPAWGDWIKKEFEKFEANNLALAEAELNRVAPKDDEELQDKWQVRVKLFTPTSIIRRKPLRWWNENHQMWKLSMAGNRRDQLYIDMVLPNTVLMNDLYDQAFDLSQLLTLCLNIGTRGFFWWSMPKHDGEYYEKISDLEKDATVTVKNPSITVIPWKQENLNENMLKNAAMCFASLVHLDKDTERGPFYKYLHGMAKLAAVTPAFRIEKNAVEDFYHSLIEGMKIFDDWDEEKSVSENLNAFFAMGDESGELKSFFKDIATRTEKHFCDENEGDETTAEHAAGLKVLCDAYFLSALHRRMVEMWEEKEKVDKEDQIGESKDSKNSA
jgi:AbiV family abortive infection protein